MSPSSYVCLRILSSFKKLDLLFISVCLSISLLAFNFHSYNNGFRLFQKFENIQTFKLLILQAFIIKIIEKKFKRKIYMFNYIFFCFV